MEKIIRGIHHFQNTIFSSHRELFQRLAGGQQPEALFITCSDSRINPNLLTQTKPGELFIMRNAGNIIPTFGAANGGEGATLEYAVTALGIRDIIVCGHSHCGAMHGLLHQDKLTSMPSVVSWLQHADATRRIVEEKYPDLTAEEKLLATVKENVLVQLANLRTHPSVAAGLAMGKITLHGWVYHIETGSVYAYNFEQKQFLRIEEVGTIIQETSTKPHLQSV
ncbi:carbonic anhydrase [Rhodocytophaga aerolata]|uniref:Carbonic anhydrase n=1 Tax=Rhodocytophaga aerolata TaxID=455078 RepID=A0ABT8RBF0_9BACT|nr:carbonic anhydrase [Rhodocytophaga aerolata]MDO1449329.1 carbonic anhydrase [Rhodocytophaga aerolata]